MYIDELDLRMNLHIGEENYYKGLNENHSIDAIKVEFIFAPSKKMASKFYVNLKTNHNLIHP